MVALLESAFALFLLLLDRTGAQGRLELLPGSLPAEGRALWALVALAAPVFLLFAALASGPDVTVRTFRALTLVAGTTLPIAAWRLAPGVHAGALGGATLAALVSAGLAHRALASRRRDSRASRAIAGTRLGLEAAGLLLFAAGGALAVSGREIPFPLMFWALFLLRLSIADLVDPSNLAAVFGIPESAARDLRTAARGGRKARSRFARAARFASGAAKALLLVLWLVLPVLAAIAPEEVRRGEWHSSARLLALYPTAAVALTAGILLVRAGRDLGALRLDGVRALAAGLGTVLWLWLAYRDPAFADMRRRLPDLYAIEISFGFLLGVVPRSRGR